MEEAADRYLIAINAQTGNLVRSGGFVGRVIAVDEQLITVDYGHPFGGEPLLCDVQVVEPPGPRTR